MIMRILIFLSGLLIHGFCLAAAVYVDPATDEKHFPKTRNLLFLKPDQQTATYRNIAKVFGTRKISAGPDVYPLLRSPVDFSDFTYRIGDETRTIDDFIDSSNIVGLIVVKDDRILFERYAAGNTEDSVWVSFSIAKSVTSMLLGAAIRDGYIKSVDEKVSHYLPALKGSSYDQASIKNVLQMASGTQWNEDYGDPNSDVANTPQGEQLLEYLGAKKRVAPPGDKFNYNTGETNLIGALIRAAIGRNLAPYLTEKIWKPFGMESDANWLIETEGGGELGGCCINATLRDYARIGIFAMKGGQLRDGTEVLADNWMRDSTTPSKGYQGYGYLWWLFGEEIFGGLGIFGQSIFIDPKKNAVIVTHSAWSNAGDSTYRQNRAEFIRAMLETL